jgi:hypothetical protein
MLEMLNPLLQCLRFFILTDIATANAVAKPTISRTEKFSSKTGTAVEVGIGLDEVVAVADWIGNGDAEGIDVGFVVGLCVGGAVGVDVGALLVGVIPLIALTYASNAGFWFPLLSKRPKLESGMAV